MRLEWVTHGSIFLVLVKVVKAPRSVGAFALQMGQQAFKQLRKRAQIGDVGELVTNGNQEAVEEAK